MQMKLSYLPMHAVESQQVVPVWSLTGDLEGGLKGPSS